VWSASLHYQRQQFVQINDDEEEATRNQCILLEQPFISDVGGWWLGNGKAIWTVEKPAVAVPRGCCYLWTRG